MPTPKKPKGVLAVYDSGGTGDRYTIVLDPKQGWERNRGGGPYGGLHQCIGVSRGLGISQFTSCEPGRHLGKKLRWTQLPTNVRSHVRNRLK